MVSTPSSLISHARPSVPTPDLTAFSSRRILPSFIVKPLSTKSAPFFRYSVQLFHICIVPLFVSVTPLETSTVLQLNMTNTPLGISISSVSVSTSVVKVYRKKPSAI